MKTTENQAYWDAKRLVQVYVQKAHLLKNSAGWQFKDIAWSNQIRIKRIASVLRAFLGMKDVEEKPNKKITSIFDDWHFNRLFEISPLLEEDNAKLQDMVKEAINDDQEYDHLNSIFSKGPRDRAQMLRFLLDFRIEAEQLLSHFEGVLEANSGGILAYHAIKGLYFPTLRDNNEKLDEMITLLLGEKFKQSFSEEELKADYGYPNETDFELDEWDIDNY